MGTDEAEALRTLIRERVAALGEDRWLLKRDVVETIDPNDVFVRCEELCLALNNPPDDIKELRLAYEHWRGHSSCGGCSHGG